MFSILITTDVTANFLIKVREKNTQSFIINKKKLHRIKRVILVEGSNPVALRSPQEWDNFSPHALPIPRKDDNKFNFLMAWYKKRPRLWTASKILVKPFALHHRSSSLGHDVTISINLVRFRDAEENICT
jgi:hypothetical protein